MMEPQQELFTYLMVTLKKEFGNIVYDGYLPTKGTSYPFIYLAESQQTDDLSNKSAIFNNVYQTINIWHDVPYMRGTVSNMAYKIKNIIRALETTDNYRWDLKNINQQLLHDDSTDIPLMRVIIDVELKAFPK